jgi:hypothetical protein
VLTEALILPTFQKINANRAFWLWATQQQKIIKDTNFSCRLISILILGVRTSATEVPFLLSRSRTGRRWLVKVENWKEIPVLVLQCLGVALAQQCNKQPATKRSDDGSELEAESRQLCQDASLQQKNEKLSLGQQVLATGVFEPGKANRDINQIIKRRMPMFENEKKILGQASIGEISSGGQAFDYVMQKVVATPTTGSSVMKNYMKLLQDRGHDISDSGLKEASCPSKKKRLEAPKPPVQHQKVDDCTKILAYNPGNKM